MIGPLRVALLLALAAYVLLRRETRNVAGLILIAFTIGSIVALEWTHWEWSNAVEAIVFGLAGGLAYYGLPRFGGPTTFHEQYEAVDRQVAKSLWHAEQAWQRQQIGDAEYAKRFMRANTRYEHLRPPSGEWTDLVQERIRIRREWAQIFLEPRSASDERRQQLGAAEAALRARIEAAASRRADQPPAT